MTDHLDKSANADMSESDGVRRHLPECYMAVPVLDRIRGACICDALRQAEQRVRAECLTRPDVELRKTSGYLTGYELGQKDAGHARGYAAGLTAARDAVAEIWPEAYCYDHDCRVKAATLAAIDALRGAE